MNDIPVESPQGSFTVRLNGVAVAWGRGPYERIKAEAMHYAAVFAKDGLVKLSVRRLPKARS